MIACLLQVPSFAQNDNHNEYEDNDNRKKYEFVKTKTVNKTYSVAARDKFSLRNSFGKVEVHTWNKNEVKVDVTVEVTANKEAVAQKIFDGISISEKQSGGEVSFKTNMKGSTNSKSDKSSMSVDYVIYLPETNELDVSNEFGATVIPNFKGKVDLTSKFGSLTTGNLADVKNILVEFGKGNFESINNGDITIKFSAANLGKLTGSTKLKFEFCSASRVNLDNNLSSLDLNASYSTINLKPANGLGAAYTIYTNFGTFKNKTAVKFDSDEDESEKGPKFDYTYTGKAGSGAIPIKVKTSFGKIILGEASEKELEEGEKKKSKKKTT
jgi:hypothetical protein